MTRSMRCLAALAFISVVGCAGPSVVDEARQRFNDGRSDEALALLQQAAKQNPNDLAVREEYFRLRELMVAQWLAQAEVLRQAGQHEGAEALYRRVQAHDAANSRAAAGLAQLEADRRHRALVASAEKLVKAGKYREAQDVLRPVLTENPQQRDARRLQRLIDDKLVKPVIVTVQLRPSTQKPISIEVRDVTVRNVFEVLQRASGINFVFDRDARTDQRTSIALRDATIEDAIRMALLTNQLEQKILNENTVFVFPNTPQKLREYQELVVKGFYLANADVKQTANMIRTLVKTRDVFIDEKINLLVIKDTPAAIRLAERLIAAQDLAEPEVMLEVEVLEVARNYLRELGPTIYLDDEVGIKVGLEVSSIVNSIKSTSGTLTYQIGTRNATTNLRLHDGETQVLAGLISDADTRTAESVPGLGDLPIAGRLFSNSSDKKMRSEIVLLITPRLQRTLARPDAGSVEFAAGTEAQTGIPRLGGAGAGILPSPPFEPSATGRPSEETGAAAAAAAAAAPAAPPPAAPVLVPFGGLKPP